MPPRITDPQVNAVRISSYVDANHYGNVISMISHTGIIIYVYNVAIIWYSNKYDAVEAMNFGSEFMALYMYK